jgi:Tfp pilus assembly protein PilO
MKLKIIDKIDAYFEEKSLKEEIMLYLLIVVMIGFLIFYVWLPTIQLKESKIKKEFINVKTTYTKLKNSYKNKTSQIIVLNKKIIALKKEIDDMKDKVDIYNEMAKSLYYTLFDKYKWGEFMKNLVIMAKKYNLHIKDISNKLFEKKDAIITKKLEVDLKVRGGYKDLIRFIYSYENTKNLLRVEKLSINNDLNYSIKFMFYGVNP